MITSINYQGRGGIRPLERSNSLSSGFGENFGVRIHASRKFQIRFRLRPRSAIDLRPAASLGAIYSPNYKPRPRTTVQYL